MKLPPATRAAVVMSPPDPGAGIIICRAPREPSIATLRAAMRARGLIASITHDAGIAWPDTAGVAISENILDGNGIAVWEFDRLVDALAAARRLRAGGVA
jgi:hypothetical protein